MTKINVNKDLTHLDDGEYTGTVILAKMCVNKKVMLKIEIDENTYFLTFRTLDEMGKYPFNQMFMAVDSDNLDDIEGLKIQFMVVNNKSKKDDTEFSNIRKIKIIE